MFVVLFDLDGTLADASEREHYLKSDPKDWEAFHADCGADELIAPIGELLRIIARDAIKLEKINTQYQGKQYVRIEIWTGREEKYRPDTIRWLNRHKLSYDRLRMRPTGDYRKDEELKGEWLIEATQEGWKPDLVFEDRARMVEFWRRHGIVCADVAGNQF